MEFANEYSEQTRAMLHFLMALYANDPGHVTRLRVPFEPQSGISLLPYT